jgi:hypothetical protein
LQRVNFDGLLKFKDENIHLKSDEWESFLCGKFSSNVKKERPIIKLSKFGFSLKWAKSKKVPLIHAKEFQGK